MYVGQIVHMQFRGRCHAAIISNFWEDQSLARLTVFMDAGAVDHSRVERGAKWDEDRTYHLLDECPSVTPVASKSEAPTQTEQEEK